MGCHPRKYKSSPKSHPRTLPSIMPVQDFCLFFEEEDHIWLGLRISIYVSGCWGMLAKDKTSSAHFPSVALCHSIRAGNSLLCCWVNLTLAWIRGRTPRVKHISPCQLFSIRHNGVQPNDHPQHPTCVGITWLAKAGTGSPSKGSEVLGWWRGWRRLKEVPARESFSLVLVKQQNKGWNILL